MTLIADDNADIQVDEAALATIGSNPTSDGETVTGDLDVTGAVNYAFAEGTNGAGTYGTLTITNAATGEYSYTLTSPMGSGAIPGDNVVNDVETFNYTATDANGNTVDGSITVDIKDDVPTIDATNAIGPANQNTYIGGIDIFGGADGVKGIELGVNSVKVAGNGVTFTDNGDGTGSFDYNQETYDFSLLLNNDNTYTLTLEGDPTTVTIGSSEALSFDQKGSGPTATYEVTYVDSVTGREFSATASSATDTSMPLSLLSIDGDAVTDVTLSTGGINASSGGFGIANNLLSSSYDKQDGTYETESFIYDPQDLSSSITLDFSGGGSNAFAGDDVLYLKVEGTGGTGQILINGAGEDYSWNGTTFSWDAISGNTSFGFENVTDIVSYTVNAVDLGWDPSDSIDTIQVTAGFGGADGTDSTVIKMEFGFTAMTTTTVTEEVEMGFTATVTDNDDDTDTVDFIVATDADNIIDGTDSDDYIVGGAGSDALYGGLGDDTLIYDSDDNVIDGGEGVNTLIIGVGDGETLDLGTVDLSNVSNINNIHVQLEGSATVIGSSVEEPLNHITPADVIDLTISDNNTLIIHSADGDDASGQVDVHTSFGSASEYEGGTSPEWGGIDGTYYNAYSSDGATLLIEIEEPIDVV